MNPIVTKPEPRRSLKNVGSSGRSSVNHCPFSLETLLERFGPALVDPTELRERSGARIRVVTAAGYWLGLAKRVFAREPLLPSDIETEEEELVSAVERIMCIVYRCPESVAPRPHDQTQI